MLTFPVTDKEANVPTPDTTREFVLTFSVDAAPVMTGVLILPVTTRVSRVTVPVLPIPAAAILVNAIYCNIFSYLSVN